MEPTVGGWEWSAEVDERNDLGTRSLYSETEERLDELAIASLMDERLELRAKTGK